MIDYGDCLLDYGEPSEDTGDHEREASKILASGAFLMSMGGDHFVTWPLLKAHAAKHGQLALVQFDAHQDTWFDDGRRIDHGSFVGRAVRDGVIDPTRSIQVGIRTHAPEDCGIRILYGYDVEDMSATQIARPSPIMSAMRPAMSPLTSTALTRPSRLEPGHRWPVAPPAPRCSRCCRSSGGLISRAQTL